MNPAANRRRTRHWLIPVIGYAVSIACLAWVYQGFSWREELPKLAQTDWRWVAVAMAGDAVVYIIQGWRWSLLLKAVAPIGIWRATQAIYIGLFANEILPLRSGEIIRVYLVDRWTKTPFTVILSSVVMERTLDGVWLVIGLYVATRFVQLPAYLATGSEILTLVLVVAAMVLASLIAKNGNNRTREPEIRWKRTLWRITHGIHDMGRSPWFGWAVFTSFLYMALQVVPVWALVRGFGLDAPVGEAAVVFLVLRIATVVPGLPSNLGTFQAATVLGLRLFGITGPQATGFATLLFVVVTIPLWIGGFIALMATKMRLQELQSQAQQKVAEPRGNLQG